MKRRKLTCFPITERACCNRAQDVHKVFTEIKKIYKEIYGYNINYMELKITNKYMVYDNGKEVPEDSPLYKYNDSFGGSHTQKKFITISDKYIGTIDAIYPDHKDTSLISVTRILAHELAHELFYRIFTKEQIDFIYTLAISDSKYTTPYIQELKSNASFSTSKLKEEYIVEYFACNIVDYLFFDNPLL